MNIVLLSGGSGMRLWPLSNDTRSKQFIKLFKNEEGTYESMLQRTYRQIKSVSDDVHITIAAPKSQASAIINQLGEDVSLCLEPARRDTFPVVALAAAYLHDELNVPTDEAVIVCPVDPYVENSYYEAVVQMKELADSGKADLTLLGIEPTYPSAKYGYIIPEEKTAVSRVKAFKEKPDSSTAEEYLQAGALWNAGVFAFRLDYILNKAHEMFAFKDYRDLYARYRNCPVISFDYAVAEKETSEQVVRYKGEWKDVGTWNMISEVMTDPAKGDVTMDDCCRNVNVVNELDIPILVMGEQNMIVAASGDGILIADKARSGYMNPYVRKISTDVHYADKSWGSYQVIDAGDGYLNIKATIKAGNRMTYHVHELRDEVWTILSGEGRTIIDGMEQIVRPGDVVTMAAGCKHTIIADTELTILETQIGDEIVASDKTKYPLDDVSEEWREE